MSNHQQQQQRQPEQQKPAFPPFDGITYFLVVDEDPDREMAQQFLADRNIDPRGDSTRAVTELRVDRLTDRHRVIGLYRRQDKDRSKRMAAPEPGMAPVLEPIHQPIQATAPIDISQFWTRSEANEFIEGTLDHARFFAALGKAMSPAVISWHPNSEPGVLRLRYS